MRRGNAACKWGRAQVDRPIKDFERLCLQFVRMAFDLPAVFPDAGTAWDRAELKHRTTDPNTIPRGVPVFWELPSVADHVALSLGGGLCLSNDVKRRGRIDVVRIDSIRTAWGAQLLGWTEDLNGARVWTPKPKAPPAPPAPVETNVSRARAQLQVARRAVAIADKFLDRVPEERTVARKVGDSLDRLDEALGKRLDRLPKR